mgnify:CR=1 FL=1
MSVELHAAGAGRFRLAGELGFASVPELPVNPPGSGDISVALDDVQRVDSAGLALLLQWVRSARSAGGQVTFTGIPSQLAAIARVSGVDAILAVDENAAPVRGEP